MEIKKTLDGSSLTMEIIGRLDTVTAPEFEKAVQSSLDGVDTLFVDLKELNYVASAGLRSLMMAQKKMNQKNGTMTIGHVQPQVQEIFEMTGFDEFLTIEK